MIDAIKHFFKERWTAKPFDLYREDIVPITKNNNYWITYKGLIYYGSRFGFWICSSANSQTWLTSERRKQLIAAINKN